MKEIKEDLKTGETYDFHEWKTQHSKVSSPQVDKQLNVIPIKLQQDSSRYKQDYSKMYIGNKGIITAKTILIKKEEEEEKKVREISLPYFKTYYMAQQ